MSLLGDHTSASVRRGPLVEIYHNLFVALPADTPERKREAHRLRYQVYCTEHNFEDPTQNPDGLEQDEFDDHAIHGILVHRQTGITVGTVRLVLHLPGMRRGCLPIHRVCEDPRVHDPEVLPLETTCELSRFAISKSFRRRIGDGTYGRAEHRGDLEVDDHRIIPHMALGLMAVALQMGMARGLNVVCAIMEPALLRLMARLGIHFESLGAPVLYHGWRQPCYATAATMLERIKRERCDIWEVITDRGRLDHVRQGGVSRSEI